MTGAAGMLANALVSELERCGQSILGETVSVTQTDVNLRLSTIHLLDVRDPRAIEAWFKQSEPDFVFHLGAETNVDLCEQDPDHAYQTNMIGTENMALACQKFDIPLLYTSTAAVFSGDKIEPYTEFDEPHAANVYGASKWFGEVAIQRLLTKYFIVRAGWMMGGWELDKKFVYKIVKQLKGGKTELNVVGDKYGSPTFTSDFARNLLPLIATKRYGLYHMANRGGVSRYEIAMKIVDAMELNGQVKVNSINSAQFPLPAPRGRSEMMRNYHLDLLGMNSMPPWEESLTRYIKEELARESQLIQVDSRVLLPPNK